jgi:outer membrane receptor protein involved in Fe transport
LATDAARSTTTNSSGLYSLASLKPATYKLTVEAQGFQKYERQVAVNVGVTVGIDPVLSVGMAAGTTLEVSANSEVATVNTENQTLGAVVSSKDLQELPTSPTRNPYSLVGTSGNVSEDSNSNRGAGYAINGLRSSSTAILLDGAENANLFNASVGQSVPLDSVQEFSVLTNNYGAEFGRASGGVVNLVTKSGTNQLHGTAYEYNRISALSANTYQHDALGTPKSRFTRNVFGGATGGPVIKNKLFFFNDIELVRVRSNSALQYGVIDPASYPLLAPASQAFFSTYGKSLVPGANISQKLPCNATSGVTCDILTFQVPADAGGGKPQNTWDEVARVDWNISNNTTLTGRYAGFHVKYFEGTVYASPYAGYNTGENDFNQNFSFNLTHVFSPSIINTSKVIYNRLNQLQGLSTAPVGPTLYNSSGVPNVSGTSIQLVYPGYSETTPGSAVPFGGPQNLYQFYDDVSISKGKHQFKFGGQFIQVRDNRVFGAYQNAVEYLGTGLSSALTNLIAGNIYQFQGAVYPQGKYPCPKDVNTGATIASAACTITLPATQPAFGRNFKYNDMAFYGQDAWKLTPRLTLNLGLRWEYYGVQHNSDPSLDSNFVMGSGSTIFDRIRNGAVQLSSNGGYFWQPNSRDFGPRVGFAWDIFGDGTTSLRGGYGLGYERNFGNVTFNAIQNPPNYGVVSLQSLVDVPGNLPVYTNNFGPLAGTGTKALPAVSQRAINQDMKSAYAETWNLSIERQLSRNSVLSVAYAGSHGIHLYDISNINPGTGGNTNKKLGGGGDYLGDALTSNRLNLSYSNINYRSDGGYSHYNGLIVGFRGNNLANTGLSLNANYTWSHALDNLSSTFTDGTAGGYMLGYIDAFNPQLNYGNADYDVRNRFTLSGVWDTPWGKRASSALVRQVVGGWSIGTVFNARSGSPFSIFDSTNYNGGSYPQWAGPSGVATTGSADLSGKPNLFNYITLPSSGGNVVNQGVSLGLPTCAGLDHANCAYTTNGTPYPRRNQFFGPGYWNLDMQFMKNFKLTERFGMQFRTEMYNIFNHHNQYIVGGNLDVAGMNGAPYVQTEKGGIYGSAGQPTDERRNIQLGLRLTF